uniref:Uncharacterized protein n=1 Tax=Chromera velia CCMP2878 TaxID=1169474 RepID=A0A0G4F5B3_9ALVE|eukprot:Cvel_15287.t1-p1 / transcript=Cvel_15287.t1 / gene=Cvel_15287 / organism=Chromera_velia_CCMP2878 / gene_product=Putative ankyrin repeat protein RF_0381, putative / transcript_product=Putative ankyrin repeat protein RF_0381, putative / location=Cvel_scaffold1121:51474-53138(-) / protein_length=555 / sequence_SO=supercontig / SO=protein_coding / is_pseudo=false
MEADAGSHSSTLPFSVLNSIEEFENSLFRIAEAVGEKRKVLANVVGAISDPSSTLETSEDGDSSVSPPPNLKVARALAALMKSCETVKRDAHAALDQIFSEYFKMDLSALFEMDVANHVRSFQAVEPETLCAAVESESLDDLSLLLNVGAHVDGLVQGETALMLATVEGSLGAVKLLVEAGADLQVQCGEGDPVGFSALHFACNEGPQLEIAEYLLSEGADPNAVDIFGVPPLHCAAMEGHIEVLELLLSRQADLNAKDHKSWSALHIAVMGGQREAVHFLLDRGMAVGQRDFRGWTEFFFTMRKDTGWGDNVEIAELLLSRGAEVDTRDNNGVPVLHVAALYGSVLVARLLIERGADVNATDPDGRTALHWAAEIEDPYPLMIRDFGEMVVDLRGREQQKLQVAQLLVEKGIDHTVESAEGLTAYDEAASNWGDEDGEGDSPLLEFFENLPDSSDLDSDSESDSDSSDADGEEGGGSGSEGEDGGGGGVEEEKGWEYGGDDEEEEGWEYGGDDEEEEGWEYGGDDEEEEEGWEYGGHDADADAAWDALWETANE